MPINASDLMAAQRAYRDARLKLIQDATQQNVDTAGAATRDQQALLDYLQTRVKLLTDTRTRAMEQFDSEIAGFQQRIGQLQQIINEAAKAAPAAPAPAAPAPPPPAPQNKAPAPDKKA